MQFRPRLSEEEYQLFRQYRNIKKRNIDGLEDAAELLNVDHRIIRNAWLKTKSASIFVSNPEFDTPQFDPESVSFEKLIASTPIIKHSPSKAISEGLFDRLVFSDVHIGMEPNPTGHSLYGGIYNKDEIFKRLHEMIAHVICNRNSDKLIIDDLGDFMDGFNGMTTRREHTLPQNMTDEDAFDTGVSFKWMLVNELLDYYKYIEFHNVCEDNHSGSFGYMVNSAFK